MEVHDGTVHSVVTTVKLPVMSNLIVQPCSLVSNKLNHAFSCYFIAIPLSLQLTLSEEPAHASVAVAHEDHALHLPAGRHPPAEEDLLACCVGEVTLH